MGRSRNYIPLPEKLAAALACLLPEAQRKELRDGKVSADDVLKLFQWHHIVYHAPPFNGADLWWNMHPMPTGEHKDRSGKDTSTIAKTKRVDKDWREFTAKMATPRHKRPKKKSKWGSRKLRSGGFRK